MSPVNTTPATLLPEIALHGRRVLVTGAARGLGESFARALDREEINLGDEGALMCVMLGSPQPITPVYPPDSPLAKIKRNTTK